MRAAVDRLPRFVPATAAVLFVLLWFATASSPRGDYRLFGGLVLLAMLGLYAVSYTSRNGRRILLLLLLLAPVTQLLYYLPALWDRPLQGTDAQVYWRAALRAEDPDLDLYVAIPEGPHVFGSPDYYLYPPFLATTLSLLPEMSARSFDRLWVAVMLGMIWVYAAALARLGHGAVTGVRILAWGMVVSLWPGALFGALIGNVEPMLWALAGLALAASGARGAGFAAAALIKPYAVWPAAVAVMRERGTAVVSAGVAVLAAVAIAVGVLGAGGFVGASTQWIRDIYPSLSQGQLMVPSSDRWVLTGNLSLSFMPLKIAHFVFGWSPDGNLPTVLRLYLTTMSVVPVLLLGWITRNRSVELHCAAVLSTAILFGPICRISYTPVFLTVAAAYWRERTANRPLPHESKPAAAISGMVTT